MDYPSKSGYWKHQYAEMDRDAERQERITARFIYGMFFTAIIAIILI